MNEPTAFGKSKAEIGSVLDFIQTDGNSPRKYDEYNSLEFLAEGMKQLANDSEARKTFGIEL